MRHALTFASIVALGLVASVAEAAPTKEQCIDADTEAQSLRTSGRFDAARELLRLCTDPACPNVVREDCTQRLDELAQHQPTIVLAARDVRGADIVKVVVKMDGTLLAERLDGRALAIDPGEHVFTFEATGMLPLERRIVVHEGAQARVESVTLADAAPAPAPAPAPTVVAKPASTATRTGAIAMGGAGVVGLGVGAVLGLMAASRWQDAKDACPSAERCAYESATSSKSSAEGLATGSTVSFVAGATLLLGGALVYWLAPGAKRRVGASTFALSF
ncbi:MAG: hypothetical protein U0270_16505 [Labilithrix sp.]